MNFQLQILLVIQFLSSFERLKLEVPQNSKMSLSGNLDYMKKTVLKMNDKKTTMYCNRSWS